MNIVCQNKKIKADKICSIEDLSCEEHIVAYTECCPYINSNNPACQKCYGRIAMSIKKIKDKDNFKIVKQILCDKYTIKHDKIKRILDASKLLDNMVVVAYETSTGSSSSGKPWTAYDRPATWKTDCTQCKQTCEAKNILPMCLNREENIKNGLPANFCNKQKQRKILIY